MMKNTSSENKSSPLKCKYSNNFDIEDVTVHSVETEFDGFFKINRYQLSHKLFNGGTSQLLSREIFERGDAVVLVPYDPVLDKVVLLEQFRPGVIRSGESPWLLEFIAGMFDEDEQAEEVAIREAKEEADLTVSPDNLIHMLDYFASPGGTSEKLFLYAALIDCQHLNIDQTVHGLPEEGEDILVHVMPREQALDFLATGKIRNAATVIGLQWLAMNYQKLQSRHINGES